MSGLSIARNPAINADIQVRQAPPLSLSRVSNPAVHRPALNSGMTPLNRPMSAPLPLPRSPAGMSRPAPVVVPQSADRLRSPEATPLSAESRYRSERLGRDVGRASERALPPSRESREAKMIRELARRNGCVLSLPFEQRKMMSTIYQQIPGLGGAPRCSRTIPRVLLWPIAQLVEKCGGWSRRCLLRQFSSGLGQQLAFSTNDRLAIRWVGQGSQGKRRE